MKFKFILLICIAVAMTSCAQMQKSMKGRNDKALKRDLEFSQWSAFTKRAGGGEKAVVELHRINMLMLADREAAFKSFSGRTEKRKCQVFASRFSNRAQRFLYENWKDQELVMAFFIHMPKSYEQVNAFRGCGVETSALDFNQIPIPLMERWLRKYPNLRTVKFRDGLLNHLAQVEALIENVNRLSGVHRLSSLVRLRKNYRPKTPGSISNRKIQNW